MKQFSLHSYVLDRMFSCDVIDPPESVSEIVSRINALSLDFVCENVKQFNALNFGFIFSCVLR